MIIRERKPLRANRLTSTEYGGSTILSGSLNNLKVIVRDCWEHYLAQLLTLRGATGS